MTLPPVINLERWKPYLPEPQRATLEALAIGARPMTKARGETFADICLAAQAAADKNNCAVVVGWQINDYDGGKEPGYGPLAALGLLTLEPVAVVYPIERIQTICSRQK